MSCSALTLQRETDESELMREEGGLLRARLIQVGKLTFSQKAGLFLDYLYIKEKGPTG